MLSQRFYPMLTISSSVSVVSTAAGLIVSYVYDLTPGGTIVIILCLFFAIAFLLRRRR